MAVVLKTTKVQAFGGSNPSPSANSEYDPHVIMSGACTVSEVDGNR